MAVRSPPRIVWAPADAAIVSYRARTVTLHDETGRALRELGHERIYDVRYRDDGLIFVLDDRGSITFDSTGALVEQTHFRTGLHAPAAASMSSVGDRYVALSNREGVFAVQLGGERPEVLWTFHARSYGVDLDERVIEQVGVEMSPDGRLVAIGYSTQQGAPRAGRGWIVVELASDQYLQRAWVRPEHRAAKPQLFAFDAAGRRLAHGIPDRDDTWGVTRLDASDEDDDLAADATDEAAAVAARSPATTAGVAARSPAATGDRATSASDSAPSLSGGFVRNVPGSVQAVALDRGGLLAAYAYVAPPPAARGRLRIDYLSPAETGPLTVEVLDTLSIDPALPDIVAVAFSRDSRQLACLASTGAIEIVPVP